MLRKLIVFLVAWDKVSPVGQKRWYFHSTRNWWTAGSSSGLLSTGVTNILERVHGRATKVIWSISYEESWELGLLTLKKAWGILSMSINTWREIAKRKESGLFQRCPVPKQEAVDTRLVNKRLCLNNRKQFVTEHWPKVPRKAVESPSLEIFNSHLDMVLGNVLCVLVQWVWTR